ncbi:hypothetical protein NPIL_234871, partial [Nephila pilipes]
EKNVIKHLHHSQRNP